MKLRWWRRPAPADRQKAQQALRGLRRQKRSLDKVRWANGDAATADVTRTARRYYGGS